MQVRVQVGVRDPLPAAVEHRERRHRQPQQLVLHRPFELVVRQPWAGLGDLPGRETVQEALVELGLGQVLAHETQRVGVGVVEGQQGQQERLTGQLRHGEHSFEGHGLQVAVAKICLVGLVPDGDPLLYLVLVERLQANDVGVLRHPGPIRDRRP
ncbi:hypothetical protein GCM10020001_014590 [Nonomuraea salmonea]